MLCSTDIKVGFIVVIQ